MFMGSGKLAWWEGKASVALVLYFSTFDFCLRGISTICVIHCSTPLHLAHQVALGLHASEEHMLCDSCLCWSPWFHACLTYPWCTINSRLCQDIKESIAPWWVSQKVMLLSVGLGLNPRPAGY